MSTAAAERPEGSGFIAWLAHHEWVIYLAMGVELVAYIVNGVMQAFGMPLAWYGVAKASSTLISWTWGITFYLCAFFGLTAVLFTFSVARHFERLCEGCISAMPLNGPELADKRKWVLRVHHFPSISRDWIRSKLGGSFKLAVIVTTLLHTLVMVLMCILMQRLFQATSLGVAFIIATTILLGITGILHRPLIPWCKWCNSGRGRGPREHVCTPPPLPTISPEPVKVN